MGAQVQVPLSLETAEADERSRGDGGRRRRSFAVFAWAFVGVGLMLGAWSVATPIGAAPDEYAHTGQAIAVVRGQFDEPELPFIGNEKIAWVQVPCWVDDPWLQAKSTACAASHTLTGRAPTEFSNAPPLYYLIVGTPSLVASGTTAFYAMRVTGDMLNAALVALGIWLLVRYYPRRTPLLGALLALSPMALFMMAVQNSSGFEIAAGFATWCGALCVVTHPEVPRALAVWTAVAVILLVLSRPTSPLDALVVAIVLAAFVGRRELRARANPSLRPLWIPVLVAVAVAAVFLLVDGAPSLLGSPPQHAAGLLANIFTTVHLMGGYLAQCIGNFGWLDIPAPAWVVAVWIAAVGALVAVALVMSAACRRALPALALATVAVTVALEAPQINTAGTYFQGRYILPLVLGFPLVASCFESRGPRLVPSRLLTRCVMGVGIVLFAAQFAAFDRALTVYKAGKGIRAGSPGTWSPPGGALTVQVVFVVGAIVTLALVAVVTSRAPEGAGTPHAPSSIPRRVLQPAASAFES